MTPAQIGVELICGNELPRFGEAGLENVTLAERIEKGRKWLVEVSGKDFGYDLVAWHDYLKESRSGSYTWRRNIVLPKVMKEALASEDWQAALKTLQASSDKSIEAGVMPIAEAHLVQSDTPPLHGYSHEAGPACHPR